MPSPWSVREAGTDAGQHSLRRARTYSHGRSPAADSRYPPRMRNRAHFTSRRTCGRTSLSGSRSVASSASASCLSPAICRTDLRAASPSTAVIKSPSPDPRPAEGSPRPQSPAPGQPDNERPGLGQQIVLRRHLVQRTPSSSTACSSGIRGTARTCSRSRGGAVTNAWPLARSCPGGGAVVGAPGMRYAVWASWPRAAMTPGYPTPFTRDLTQPMEGRL